MEKIKNWYEKNKGLLMVVGSSISALIMAYLGFKRGVRKTDVDQKQEQIDHLKSKVETVILKEKLEDSKKDINEISSDVDDILDRNK